MCIDFLKLKAPSTWLFFDSFENTVEINTASPKMESRVTVI